jgi:hypothetical protein
MTLRPSRHSRVRTPGLRPRCDAIHPRTGARCLKPEDHSQNHEWSIKVYTKHTTRNRPAQSRPLKRMRSTQSPRKKFISKAARLAALDMVEDPIYRRKLLADLRARTLRPAVECMLWFYAKGKPKEMIEHSGTLQLEQELACLTEEELRDRALAIAATLKRDIH